MELRRPRVMKEVLSKASGVNAKMVRGCNLGEQDISKAIPALCDLVCSTIGSQSFKENYNDCYATPIGGPSLVGESEHPCPLPDVVDDKPAPNEPHPTIPAMSAHRHQTPNLKHLPNPNLFPITVVVPKKRMGQRKV